MRPEKDGHGSDPESDHPAVNVPVPGYDISCADPTRMAAPTTHEKLRIPLTILARDKIKGRAELGTLLERLRDDGKRVVFTNGCFDLLHPGHVRYLESARSYGDALVVAINSDASVRSLKGPDRPIQSELDRGEILGSLSCVDFVTVFDEPTPLETIEALRPDVLVKGGDWTRDQIVGRDFVESAGGRVIAIEFEDGYSTTSIVDRIRGIGEGVL